MEDGRVKMEARTLEPVAFEEREEGRGKRLAGLGSDGRGKREEGRKNRIPST